MLLTLNSLEGALENDCPKHIVLTQYLYEWRAGVAQLFSQEIHSRQNAFYQFQSSVNYSQAKHYMNFTHSVNERKKSQMEIKDRLRIDILFRIPATKACHKSIHIVLF